MKNNHHSVGKKSLRIIRFLLPIQFHRRRNSMVFPRENIILAKRKSFPVIGTQNPAKIRMPVEDDAEHVKSFALMPIGRSPEIGDTGNMGIVARTENFHRDAVAMIE